MLFWATLFLIMTITSSILGFSGVAGAAGFIARELFVVFLTGFIFVIAFGIWLVRIRSRK